MKNKRSPGGNVGALSFLETEMSEPVTETLIFRPASEKPTADMNGMDVLVLNPCDGWHHAVVRVCKGKSPHTFQSTITITTNSDPMNFTWRGLYCLKACHSVTSLSIRKARAGCLRISWFSSAGRTPDLKSNFYMAFLIFSAKNRSVNLGNSANDREMIHWR